MTKKVTVVTDNNDEEAIYVDGVKKLQDCTIYACDISQFIGNEPILFQHQCCELEDEQKWPEKLEDVPLVD